MVKNICGIIKHVAEAHKFKSSKVFDDKLKKLAKFELKKIKKMLTSAETSDKIRESLEGDTKTTKSGNGL